jgi:hypothetical protein
VRSPRRRRPKTHGIVRIVLLDESAQERAGRVPLPPRRRQESGVERFGRLGRGRVCRHGCKVHLGLVELARLEIHAAERGAHLAVRVRRLVLLRGEGLQQRGGGRKVLTSIGLQTNKQTNKRNNTTKAVVISLIGSGIVWTVS